jgi:predicted transposase/invertase (TIGR01784 family)
MPKFKKTLDELDTKFDKWLYVLKNLDKFERIPEKIKDKIFQKLFKTAELAKFSLDELKEYEASMNAYRDIKNSVDTAFEKGIEKGERKKAIKVAKKMIAKGLEASLIAEMTGLTKKEIEDLKQ